MKSLREKIHSYLKKKIVPYREINEKDIKTILNRIMILVYDDRKRKWEETKRILDILREQEDPGWRYVKHPFDWQAPVLDKDCKEPPVNPDAGDRYIVAPGSIGNWKGHEHDIAEWNGTGWDFTSPEVNFICWVEDENQSYFYNGTSWGKLPHVANTMYGLCWVLGR